MDLFGQAVAIDGDVLAVGAPGAIWLPDIGACCHTCGTLFLLWAPGEPRPPFDAAARKLAGRWRGCGRRNYVLLARRDAGSLWSKVERLDATSFEGMNRFLGVAEIYLGYLREGSALAADWRPWTTGEGAAPDEETILPDAVVPRAAGGQLALKYAGRYSARQLRSFHAFCDSHELAYDLR